MRARLSIGAPLVSILFLGIAASCGRGDSAARMHGDLVQVGTASLEVPAGWQPTLEAATNRQVWVPANNARKESISIRVVDRSAELGTVDDVLDNTLDATGVLADVRLGRQQRVTTADGLPGLWVDLTFTPGTSEATYARSQLTVVTATHIIHVFYTALTPDPQHRAVALALETLREES